MSSFTEKTSDKQRALKKTQEYLLDYLPENANVLEVGCGSNSQLRFSKSKEITGIDISKEQLERNLFLKNKILGDIQSYDFGLRRFDLIICWDVLEHLKKPSKAILNMLHALNDRGILVIKVPNLLSFKGLITKITPHFLHVLYYQKILGRPLAGTQDRAPFPTFLKFDVTLSRINQLCVKNDVSMEFFAYFTDIEINTLPPGKKRNFFTIINIISLMLRFLTFNFIRSYEQSDFLVVFRKKN